MNNLSSIRQQHGIPEDYGSCHTAIIDGYTVEGHVPVEAIIKLLTEKPNIDGIALPGMADGAPGMDGIQTRPYTIYALKNGKASDFMTFGPRG